MPEGKPSTTTIELGRVMNAQVQSLTGSPDLLSVYRMGVEMGAHFAVSQYKDDHPESDAENETRVPPSPDEAFHMGVA